MPASASTGPRCIIFNPAAGRGRAQRQIRRLQALRRSDDTFLATSGPGHAEDLAEQAAHGSYETIIAAGGDGTVHEVANGILRSGQRRAAFAPWPIGSANDFAFGLGLPADWPLRPDVELHRHAVDAGQLECGSTKRFFVNGVGLGFNAAVTAESRGIPYLRGMALYGSAFFLAALRRYRSFDSAIEVDGVAQSPSLLAMTVNLGPREGGFLVTPTAKLDDGWFNIVRARPMSRLQALALFPALAQGRLPISETLQQMVGRQIVVHSPSVVPIHLDGELVSLNSFSDAPIVISLLPAALTVLATRRSPYLVS